MAESSTSVPQHVSVGRIDSSTRFPTTGNPHPGESMTKLTTPRQKDSANTDLPSSTTPTTRTSAWIPRIRSHQTKPISRTTPSRKQSRLTLTRPPSSPTHQRTAQPARSTPRTHQAGPATGGTELGRTRRRPGLAGRPSAGVPPRDRTPPTHRGQAGAIPGTPYRGDGTPAPDPRTKPPRHAQRPATPGRGTRPGAAPHASPGLYPGRAPDERPTQGQSAPANPRRGP